MENLPFEDVFPIGKGGFPASHVSFLEGKLKTIIPCSEMAELVADGLGSDVFFFQVISLCSSMVLAWYIMISGLNVIFHCFLN